MIHPLPDALDLPGLHMRRKAHSIRSAPFGEEAAWFVCGSPIYSCLFVMVTQGAALRMEDLSDLATLVGYLCEVEAR